MNPIAQLTMATAGAGFLSLGINLAPAHAVLLNFSHGLFSNCPECAQQFSFTLDTSVLDQNPSLTEGFYPNAISAIKLDGLPIVNSTTSVRTRDLLGPSPFIGLGPGEYTQFSYSIVGDPINLPPYGAFQYAYNISLYFQGNSLVNQLLSEPSAYVLSSSFSNAQLGPGGSLRGSAPGSVNVTRQQDSHPNPNPIPEPSPIAGFSLVGLSLLLKKKTVSFHKA